MELCNTDIKKIIFLLNKGADLIDQHTSKPCDKDKARLMRNMSKKLSKRKTLKNKT